MHAFVEGCKFPSVIAWENFTINFFSYSHCETGIKNNIGNEVLFDRDEL